MSSNSAEPGIASPPWRLLLVGSLLGFALTLVAPVPSPTTAGRAQLTAVLPPNQPGWQLQIDPLGLGLTTGEAQKLLSGILGEEVPLNDLPQADDQLFHLTKIEGDAKISVTPAPPAKRRSGVDPIFGGGPSAVFEWSKRAFVVRGNLFGTSGRSSLLAGRLIGTLPFSGLKATGDGFTLDHLGPLPRDFDRLLAIDPAMLRFHINYRAAIQKEWDRWEFFPLTQLGTAIGPALVYTRWRGDSLFSVGIKDMASVESVITKRFPESVIKASTRRSHGTRLRGFEPDGPAWLIRGDTLLATKTGGINRLESALSAALENDGSVQNAPFEEPDELMPEVRRLAATEKGWHVVVIMAEPKSALHWAALIRWPEPTRSQVTGFLVVQPNNNPSR